MTKIVVGVDGSEQSAAALRWAAREAALRDAELTAVLVWDLFNQRHADGSQRFDPAYDGASADAALEATIVSAVGGEAAAGVTRLPVCDVPAHGLIEAAKGADLLVVGARGLGGFRELLLGSVSQQVLHHASGAVAIVRPVKAAGTGGDEAQAAADRGGERIVVGVDGSDPSNAALRWALAEGRLRGATVEAVHSWEVPVVFGPVAGSFPYDTEAIEKAGRELLDQVVDAALADLGPPEVTVERTLTVGGPALNLLDAAKHADLMVIGRRGLGGFKRLMLGSVSEHVARHSPCPVVIMAPEEKVS